jgi:hypothetical protein
MAINRVRDCAPIFNNPDPEQASDAITLVALALMGACLIVLMAIVQ